MAQTTTINLTPKGMETPEGCARVAEAQNAWERSTAEFANMASQFIDDLREHGAKIPPALCDDLRDLRTAQEERRQKQDEFLRALCGR